MENYDELRNFLFEIIKHGEMQKTTNELCYDDKCNPTFRILYFRPNKHTQINKLREKSLK